MVGGEQRIKATMNEITPTRPSKVKKSKIRPKLKPIVSPTDDNYDDEGELGYGDWTPSKRRQQSPENGTPKDDEKKDERCDTLKLQSESSNKEIRTDNAMSNASDNISLTKSQLSFDNKLMLSESDDMDNEKDNRANECVSQVTYSLKKLNDGNKSKCVDGVWIESTCSLLRSRVWQGFIILLCIAGICEVLCISIVIKYRLSHNVESSNISDTSALDKELSYVDYKEESSSGNNSISETGRDVLPITETVEESVVNETSSLLDKEIQDASEVEVKNMGSEEVTAPVKEYTEANASETDEPVKEEVENEEVPLLRETQDSPEIEMQFRAGQGASSVLAEEVTEDNAPTIELDNEKVSSPLVKDLSKTTERFNFGEEGEEAQAPLGMRHEKHEEGEVVSQTQEAPTKNEQVELEQVPGVAIEDDSQDITTPQKESVSLSDEVDRGMISAESDQDAETTLNLLRDEEPKMKLGMTRSDEEHNHSDNSMIPSGDEELESDSDELPEMNFVEVDLEASDELPDTSFAESKEIKGVNRPVPSISTPENVESDEQGYGNPNLIGVEKDGADTKGSNKENEHELHKVRPLTKETKREFLAKLNQFEDAFESYEVIDALIGHVACAVPKLLLKRVLGLLTKVTFSRK